MSSILKALKKLEEERARREPGAVNIACDILRSRPRRRNRSGASWGVAVAVALGLGLAGTALFWWTIQPATSPPGRVRDSGQTPSNPVAGAAFEPRSAAVAAKPSPDPAGRTERPAKTGDPVSAQAIDVAASLPDEAAPARPVVDPTEKAPDRSPAPDSAPAEAQMPGPTDAGDPGGTQDEPGHLQAPAAEAAAATERIPHGSFHLTLHGIAWQDQRSKRMAIINDLPVLEGTVVEGARVLEILPDRVRLERNDETFVLKLD